MTLRYFDTHCHLDQEQFDADRAAVIARAEAAGVVGMLALGITAASSAATVAIAEAHPRVYAAVGIHPNSAAEEAPGDWDRIRALAAHPKVVAIGETGLDKHWDLAPFDLQQALFARHMELSRAVRKPFAVHCRDCEPDVLAMLREEYDGHGPILGIMHSYCGSIAGAEACLAMGMQISFAGMSTYKKADDVRAVAAIVPAERILIETDAPYLAPTPFRGKRNEPAYVVHTAAKLAEVRGVPLEEFARQTTENAITLFGIAAEPG